MKTVKYLLLRVLMCSGLFLNATAQNDLVGLHLPANISIDNLQDCCNNNNELTASSETVNFYEMDEMSSNDSWIENKTRVSITQLPKSVLKTLVDEYEVYAVLNAEEVETSVRKAFKVRIEKDQEEWDILLNRKGEIILEEKITY